MDYQTEMTSKPSVLLFANKTYYGDKTDNSYDKAIIDTWLKANNKKPTELNIKIEVITKGYLVRNGFYARIFWEKYKKLSQNIRIHTYFLIPWRISIPDRKLL